VKEDGEWRGKQRGTEGHESNNADTTIVDTFTRFALVDKSLPNSITQQVERTPLLANLHPPVTVYALCF